MRTQEKMYWQMVDQIEPLLEAKGLSVHGVVGPPATVFYMMSHCAHQGIVSEEQVKQVMEWLVDGL